METVEIGDTTMILRKSPPILYTLHKKVHRNGVTAANPALDALLLSEMNFKKQIKKDPNIKKLLTDEFWSCFPPDVIWTDKGESSMDCQTYRIRLLSYDTTRRKFLFIREFLPILMDDLKATIQNQSDTKLFDTLNPSQQKMLLSHIIAKGKKFYDSIIDCPDIANYLIEGDLYMDFNQIFKET